MRKFLGCCSLFLLGSCLDETRVDPATPSTYVRYINGGIHDYAKAMEKTSDGGYIILANTSQQLLTSNQAQNTIRIKLIKVNAYGSVQWSLILPAGADDNLNYIGNGISVTETGYIVSGEVIQKSGVNTGQSKLLILQANASGTQSSSFSVDLPEASGSGVSVSGQAAAELSPNRLLILASITGQPENMILAEINTGGASPAVAWDWAYGSGASTIINKLFLGKNNEVIFGGTVTRNNNFTDLRLVRAVQNSQGTDFDLNFGDPNLSEQANSICKTPNGYAMVGSTNVTGKPDRDIQFTRFSESGALLTNRTYPVYYPATLNSQNPVDVGLNEEGNAVCTTSDNGFVILATIVSATSVEHGALGRGERDYYLMKINAFGDLEWQQTFGSKRDDTGVAVLQSDDGGYVILGTTMLANLATIALIKTNSLGEIE